MSEETDPRDVRSAQLVDEPTEQANRLEQDPDQDEVSDRNEDGTVDTVTDDDQAAVDSDEALREDDDAAVADADRAAADVDDDEIGDTADEAAADDGTADVGGERDELMPGDMDAELTAEPIGTLWSSETAGELRGRWQELQLRFVDDPRGVVTEAQSLVGEAVEGLTTSLTDQQRELDGWASGGDGETEQLRVALQRYRDFFDRVLGQG
jgi:hypothetical protein